MVWLIVYLVGYIPIWFLLRHHKKKIDGYGWANVGNRISATVIWPICFIPFFIIWLCGFVDDFTDNEPPKWL